MERKNEMKKMAALSAEAVFDSLATSPNGLPADEAARRLAFYGPNQLPKAVTLSLGLLLWQQFTHMMALLLWAAGGLAFAVDLPELGWASWLVILINALFSFWQEYRADRALSALSAMLPREVKVYRDGQLEIVRAEQIVLGDVLVVEAGDHISADARLVEAEDLQIDVSLLTGESLPVDRDALPVSLEIDPANLLYAGTLATAGRGVAVVYAVGRETELGRVSKLTAGLIREKSSLERQVQKIVHLITLLALSMGGLVFALAIGWMGLDWRAGFIFCIGIIVANVPEGLLPTVSLSLAVGVQRMAKEKALVRKLSAVESLCATSVICTDKTGTITMNEVTVKKLWLPEGEAEVSGTGYKKQGEITISRGAINAEIELLLLIGSVCSEADIETSNPAEEEWNIIGDPTEVALLVAAAKNGQMVADIRAQFAEQQTKQFNSQKKMMSTFCRNQHNPLFKTGTALTFVKGAPVETLAVCRYRRRGSNIFPLDHKERQNIIAANDRLASEGYRVLAFAYREGEAELHEGEGELVFVGLAAMMDPPRPEVASAVQRCREAGIAVTMITGDYGLTAAAIARQIGIIDDAVSIVTGSELEAMTEKNLRSLLLQDKPIVFARATPEHKLKIVQAYKAAGHIVAVTGDGVNDAPALRAADVGIAMGKGGTDVARAVADIVLLDDNFATIVKAIEQGRAIYDNIRKFMTYILASNIPEIVPFLAMVFLHIPPALNILQILAIDIGTDMVPALALGAETPEQGVLRRKPSDYSQNLLDPSLLLRAYSFLGVIEAVLSMAAFFFVWNSYGYSLADIQQLTESIMANTAAGPLQKIYQQATTMAMAAIIACQLGNILVCRSEYQPFWQIPIRSNLLILWGVVSELLLTAALLYVPFLAAIFMTQPLRAGDFFILCFCPLLLIAMEESRRYFVRRFF